MLKSKRTSLRYDSKEIQLACGGWDWKNVVSPRQEGEWQQTAHTALREGDSRHLSSSVELPQPLSYLSIFPIYSLLNRSLHVCHLGNSPSVTQCRWLQVVPWGFSQSSSDTSFMQTRFLLLFSEVNSSKILQENFVLWWFIHSKSGHHSNKRKAVVCGKKKINKKIDAYIFPNQFTHSWKKTQSSNVSLNVRMQNNAQLSLSKKILLYLSHQIQKIISYFFLLPQIFTCGNVK